MKDSTPGLVILLRFYCLYLLGDSLHWIGNVFLDNGWEPLLWLIEDPAVALDISCSLVISFLLLYCTIKPSNTALALVRFLLVAALAQSIWSAARLYLYMVEVYGLAEIRSIFPPIFIIRILIDISVLFLFLVSKTTRDWFRRYGLKE